MTTLILAELAEYDRIPGIPLIGFAAGIALSIPLWATLIYVVVKLILS